MQQAQFRITGGADYQGDIPVDGHVVFTPQSGSEREPLELQYSLRPGQATPRKPYYEFQGVIRHGDRFINVAANGTVYSELNWEVQLLVSLLETG